jgi:hypothetical protein
MKYGNGQDARSYLFVIFIKDGSSFVCATSENLAGVVGIDIERQDTRNGGGMEARMRRQSAIRSNSFGRRELFGNGLAALLTLASQHLGLVLQLVNDVLKWRRKRQHTR